MILLFFVWYKKNTQSLKSTTETKVPVKIKDSISTIINPQWNARKGMLYMRCNFIMIVTQYFSAAHHHETMPRTKAAKQKIRQLNRGSRSEMLLNWSQLLAANANLQLCIKCYKCYFDECEGATVDRCRK